MWTIYMWKISGSFILKCVQDDEAYIENVDGARIPKLLSERVLFAHWKGVVLTERVLFSYFWHFKAILPL